MQGNERGNPRDYYITTEDVFNIKTSIEQLSWRQSADQAQSVRLFTELHKENILFYQEVQPLPGRCMVLKLPSEFIIAAFTLTSLGM